jgi:subtilisin family serine protease
MYNAGVPVVVAAGNGNIAGRAQDACNYSPAGAPNAYTVGATTNTDAKTSWSNYGSCVNIFAPGASITSAWYTSDTATNTISGTSMASPHVAGVAALYLQANTDASAQAVYDALTNNSTKNIVTSSNTTNNHLVYSLFGAAPPPADPTATPTPNPTSTPAPDPTATPAPDPTATPTPSDPTFTLSVYAYKVQGLQKADLTWSGATSTNVDIYRDGSKIIPLATAAAIPIISTVAAAAAIPTRYAKRALTFAPTRPPLVTDLKAMRKRKSSEKPLGFTVNA